jgi:hypothetical protein
MDFDLTKATREILAKIANNKKRDLSFFSGIEFYAKAETMVIGHFRLLLSDRDDPNMIDSWTAVFEIGTEWEKIKIPFEQLTIGRAWIREGSVKYGAKPGKQILDLSRVEAVSIGVWSGHNPPVKGTIWIDKVRFYRE